MSLLTWNPDTVPGTTFYQLWYHHVPVPCCSLLTINLEIGLARYNRILKTCHITTFTYSLKYHWNLQTCIVPVHKFQSLSSHPVILFCTWQLVHPFLPNFSPKSVTDVWTIFLVSNQNHVKLIMLSCQPDHASIFKHINANHHNLSIWWCPNVQKNTDINSLHHKNNRKNKSTPKPGMNILQHMLVSLK